MRSSVMISQAINKSTMDGRVIYAYFQSHNAHLILRRDLSKLSSNSFSPFSYMVPELQN